MGNWNRCQCHPISVTTCPTLIWISIYFCIYFGFPVIYHHFTTTFTAFWYIFHVFNARNDRFSFCISRLRHTFRPNHPKNHMISIYRGNGMGNWNSCQRSTGLSDHGERESWFQFTLTCTQDFQYRARFQCYSTVPDFNLHFYCAGFQFTFLLCWTSIYTKCVNWNLWQ